MDIDDDDDDDPGSLWRPKKLAVEGWIGCSAHQLQLVVNDGYKELRGYHRVQNILGKAKAISALSHRSSHFAYALSHKIPVPCDTRWNSFFKLYEHVVKYFEDINKGLESIKRNDLIISRAQKEVHCRCIRLLL